MRKGISY